MEEVAISRTSLGNIVIEFFEDMAPGHVANFKNLANDGFYDGTCFHRVIPNFMIQGGDPLTRDDDQQNAWGTGGPRHQIEAEFNELDHVPGTLSMARSQSPDSAGSQFFICVAKAPQLNGQYTNFGMTLEGLEVAREIVDVERNQSDRPLERVDLMSVKIVPKSEYQKE